MKCCLNMLFEYIASGILTFYFPITCICIVSRQCLTVSFIPKPAPSAVLSNCCSNTRLHTNALKTPFYWQYCALHSPYTLCTSYILYKKCLIWLEMYHTCSVIILMVYTYKALRTNALYDIVHTWIGDLAFTGSKQLNKRSRKCTQFKCFLLSTYCAIYRMCFMFVLLWPRQYDTQYMMVHAMLLFFKYYTVGACLKKINQAIFQMIIYKKLYTERWIQKVFSIFRFK